MPAPPVPDTTLPVIDVAALVARLPGRDEAARRIGAACRAHGFFYAVGHGVDAALGDRLESVARRFFALDEATKARWRMALGGRAWRGWFPLGGELTSNRPDWKEGLYLGSELPADHPRVRAGMPVHGANLWPDVPGLRETVLDYLAAVTRLGHALMEGIALSLGLPADYFAVRYTADPLILLRLFNYPSRPVPPGADVRWGVGEHTDYGLLTILRQDDVGGLEVQVPGPGGPRWIAAPPLPDSFVCNIGDMLDRMTGGRYRSTPHRVAINRSGRDRLSFPLFFDPDFEARVQPIEGLAGAPADDSATRWDGANVHAFDGRYGDYLLAKVGKVFPELGRAVL
jgi:isopenicillin N synthase-like dioxygenase